MQIEINDTLLKAGTKKAKNYLQDLGYDVSTGDIYEMLALMHNYPSWNVMARAIKDNATSSAPTVKVQPARVAAPLDIDVLRKRADRQLELYDFTQDYDQSRVVDTGGWEWSGLEQCHCSVFLEFDDDEEGTPSTRVCFTVTFNKNGKVTSVSTR